MKQEQRHALLRRPWTRSSVDGGDMLSMATVIIHQMYQQCVTTKQIDQTTSLVSRVKTAHEIKAFE